ncbi:MAG: hypothetical protein II913_03645 [Elusimicrobiaceae bacterium]|nr:hypothetical protein [Elusimicrobiaceae bacterium]
MRYLAAILGLLLATLPAFAQDKKMLLRQLTQEMSTLGFLPAALQTTAPTRLKLVYLPDGALARWNPKTDTFEISKIYWKQSPHVHCLLPLFVHESVHAHVVKQARTLGFAWPVTLSDEVPAFYYQLKTEETLPDYAQACAPWRAELTAERRALAAQNGEAFQRAVYERYSQFPGKNLPPPPLAEPWTVQAQSAKQLTFYQHTYKLQRRTLSAEKFWRKGGSWLRLTPNELERALQDPRYLLYRQLLVQYLSPLNL